MRIKCMGSKEHKSYTVGERNDFSQLYSLTVRYCGRKEDYGDCGDLMGIYCTSVVNS